MEKLGERVSLRRREITYSETGERDWSKYRDGMVSCREKGTRCVVPG